MIPPRLGAGKTVRLDKMLVPVNMGKPNDDDSAVMFGAHPESPIGPKVIVGVTGTNAEAGVRVAMMAFLDPDEAIELAAQLLLAASTVEEANRKAPRQ
jgi:hypothetical protein